MNTMQQININGYDTYFSEEQDSHGSFLLIAIPINADKDISDICNTFVNGHMIKEIDYHNTENTKFIKAYY